MCSYIRRGESHWWMKGSTPPQIAEIIIKLVKDMAAGHLSDAWSRVTKNAIAETIIALTKMEEEHRSPVRCIATTRVRLFSYHTTILCVCLPDLGSNAISLLSHFIVFRFIFGKYK
jgi:hypothetical protein